MNRLILGAAMVSALIGVGCEQGGTVATSVTGPALVSQAQLSQSTIAVLDGTTWANGDYWVTKYPNYPAEPPSPKYAQRVTNGPADPCTIKWPGYETNYIIYDEYPIPPTHWCQLDD